MSETYDFVETDSESIIESLISKYETRAERTLYPADPMRLIILWLADIIVQERVLINETAKQNVPRYAEDENLDALGELFRDTERLEESSATTMIRVYITEAQAQKIEVDAGLRINATGTIYFETIETLNIPAGELYGDVKAECLTAGTAGNDFLPGQITKLVDISSVPYFSNLENITKSSGGSEEETNAAYYKRMREAMESFSTAGPAGAYQYFTKSASSLISDVVVDSSTDGTVDIRVLLENGDLPDEELLSEILADVSSDKIRPLTDHVTVSAPDQIEFDIDMTYYISSSNESSSSAISEKISSAVSEYVTWQTEKMNRDVNPSYLSYLVMSAGAKRVVVRKPVSTVVSKSQVAVLSNKTVLFGGTEDE